MRRGCLPSQQKSILWRWNTFAAEGREATMSATSVSGVIVIYGVTPRELMPDSAAMVIVWGRAGASLRPRKDRAAGFAYCRTAASKGSGKQVDDAREDWTARRSR